MSINEISSTVPPAPASMRQADAPPTQQQIAEQQLDAVLEPIIGNTINGLTVTVKGLPPEVLANAVARITGRIVGRIASSGPLTAVLTVRSNAKNKFAEAMDGVKIIGPAAGGFSPQG